MSKNRGNFRIIDGELRKYSSEDTKELFVPKGVTTIGDRAFYECKNLEYIHLPQEITSIGDFAFHSCTGLKSITLPKNITHLGEYAFCNCNSVETVDLSNTKLTCIPASAFYGCENLESIKFPKGITSIEESAFGSCKKLKNITIPNTVTTLSSTAFSECDNLESITLPSSFDLKNALYLTDYKAKILVDLSIYKSEDLNQTLVSKVFNNIPSIEKCENTSPSLFNSWILYLRRYAYFFYDEIIDNEDTLLFMTKHNALLNVDITPLIKRAEKGNKENIIKVLEEYQKENIDNDEINYSTKDYRILKTSDTDDELTIVKYTGSDTNITIPQSIKGKKVTSLDETFSLSIHILEKEDEVIENISSITVPSSIKEIKKDTFTGCVNSTSLVLPKENLNLDVSVFNYICYNLKNIEEFDIPEGVSVIEENAFSNCEKLKRISIPSSVKEIKSCAFSNCKSLEKIVISSFNKYYKAEDGVIYNKDNYPIFCIESKKEECDFDFSLLTNNLITLSEKTSGTLGVQGEYVLFGDYPQTLKEKDVLIDEKHKYIINGFECYKGNDNCYYTKLLSSFDSYIVKAIGDEMVTTFKNGEEVIQNHYYYFKIESIKWRLLSNTFQGGKLLLSEEILDTHAFDTLVDKWGRECENNIEGITIEGSNYEYSSIRAYLNGFDIYKNKGFINKAFTPKAIQQINTVTVSNNKMSSIEHNYFSYEGYKTSSDTKDKIFLLSLNDVSNTNYGFSKMEGGLEISEKFLGYSRRKTATDYVRAKGIVVCRNINSFLEEYTNEEGCGNWYLRTSALDRISGIDKDGLIDNLDGCNNYIGIAPSLSLSVCNNTYIVSKEGGGDFFTINDALENAKDGDRIFINSGVYNERIEVSKDIQIIGDEYNNPVLSINCEKGCKITSNATIRNIIFKNDSSILEENSNSSLVEVTSNAHFDNCEFSSNFSNAVLVSGEYIKPSFYNCIIHDCKYNCVKFLNEARPTVYNCDIYNAQVSGITVDNSYPFISDCKIHNVGEKGISIKVNDSLSSQIYKEDSEEVLQTCSVLVSECDIYDIEGENASAILYEGNSSLVVKDCNIYNIKGDNKTSGGVMLLSCNKALIQGCKFQDIEGYGIGPSGELKPNVRNCTFADSVKEKSGFDISFEDEDPFSGFEDDDLSLEEEMKKVADMMDSIEDFLHGGDYPGLDETQEEIEEPQEDNIITNKKWPENYKINLDNLKDE